MKEASYWDHVSKVHPVYSSLCFQLPWGNLSLLIFYFLENFLSPLKILTTVSQNNFFFSSVSCFPQQTQWGLRMWEQKDTNRISWSSISSTWECHICPRWPSQPHINAQCASHQTHVSWLSSYPFSILRHYYTAFKSLEASILQA